MRDIAPQTRRPPGPSPRRLALGLALLALWASLPVPAATTEPPTPELRRELIQAARSATSFHDRFDAEVWLLDMSNRLASKVPDPTQRLRLLKMIHQEAVRAHLPPNVVLAVIQVESNFDRFAISDAGAQGLMQVMPFWLNVSGIPNGNLFHVRTNLRLGCTILRYYLDQEHGDLRKALARYNGSVGKNWYPQRVFMALQTTWYKQ